MEKSSNEAKYQPSHIFNHGKLASLNKIQQQIIIINKSLKKIWY